MFDGVSGERMARLFATLASAAVLAGCAAQRPPSLDVAADDVLRGASLASLAAPASALKHPRLAPVEIDPAKPLTPQAVAVLAVLANPDLKAARARAHIADAQTLNAGLLPDPTFNLAGDFRQSGPDTGNGWSAQLAYELTAIRDRNIVLTEARRAQAQVRLDLAWQEWTTAEQARLLAVRIVSLTTISRLATESRAEADKALRAGAAAAQRGDIRADDLQTRRLAMVDATDRQVQAEKDLAAARLDLNSLLGLRPDTALRIAAEPVATFQKPRDREALFAAARTQRLDLMALKAGYESQNATVRKAVMDRFPSFQLTLGTATDTANNRTFGPAVNFTLPVWNRNRGGIAIATATQDALRAEYAARVFTARADIYSAADALDRTARQRRVLHDQIIDLRRVTTASDAADRRGDVSDTTAMALRQTLRDREAAMAALDQAVAEQTISLELATGGPLK